MQSTKRLTREEQRAVTRTRLLKAAERLFVAHGFGATSIRDIAEEAGFSQGAFYSNFESKDDLLFELLDRHKQEEADRLAALIEATQGSLSALQEGLAVWAEQLDQQADWAILTVEIQLQARRSVDFARRIESFNRQQGSRFGQLVALIFARHGKALPMSESEIAEGLIAMMQGLVLIASDRPAGTIGRILRGFILGLLHSAADEA